MSNKKAAVVHEVKLVPSQVKQAMIIADAVRDSLMLWGSPGIGKSQLTKQYADEMYPLLKDNVEKLAELERRSNFEDEAIASAAKAELQTLRSRLLDQEINFIDFRLSQIEPTDLRGIPVPEKVYQTLSGNDLHEYQLKETQEYITKTAVVWAEPKLLQLPANWKGVIIFDEINSAMPIVQAASYQLILDRRVGELKIPDGAFIVAAGNRDGDGGVTFPLATPLRDRMTHLEMTADFDDWLNGYAITHRVHPRVIGYLKNATRSFNTLSKDDKSHSGGTSPRSWVRISDYEHEADRRGASVDRNTMKAIFSGRLSHAVALEYITFCENVRGLPETMSVLDGTTKDMPADADVAQNYFITINLAYRIMDFHKRMNEADVGDKPFTDEKWNAMCNNYITFMMHNFKGRADELNIMSIRTLTKAGVIFKYDNVPAFRDFVKHYQPMLHAARSV